MFKINQLVIVNGYVCMVKDIYNDVYYLLHIDGTELSVKESQLYKYLGQLCLSTFHKERNKNIRNNRIYKTILFTILISIILFVNTLSQGFNNGF